MITYSTTPSKQRPPMGTLEGTSPSKVFKSLPNSKQQSPWSQTKLNRDVSQNNPKIFAHRVKILDLKTLKVWVRFVSQCLIFSRTRQILPTQFCAQVKHCCNGRLGNKVFMMTAFTKESLMKTVKPVKHTICILKSITSKQRSMIQVNNAVSSSSNMV